jgi:hypothetical protein
MSSQKQSLPPVMDICDLLWEQVEKPKNLETCRAINVYDNKYRINVYTRFYDKLNDQERVRITQSYFCRLDGDQLVIRA